MSSNLRARSVGVVLAATLLGSTLGFATTPVAAAQTATAPVHRFYNASTGTHFYTASEDEKAFVQATWPALFVYEGAAFETFTEPMGIPELEACRVPLYRFYSKRSGSHFYTMSPAERDYVVANYAGTYVYEGEAFYVFTEGAVAWDRFYPVHRFYNRTNGSHFYTMSPEEKSLVQLMWPSTYRYEGIAFWADTYHQDR